MTDLLPRVEAMLQGIVEEKVRDATRYLVRDLNLARSDYSFVRGERDRACADRDKAVRDAQALREQVQALELRLLEVRKPATLDEARIRAGLPTLSEPLEVDGFRVGDLVRYLSDTRGQPRDHWRAIERFNHQRAVYRQSGECGIETQFLTRKPVEVGDQVRVIKGHREGASGVVDGIIGGEARVVVDPLASLGDAPWVELPRLVAIAK